MATGWTPEDQEESPNPYAPPLSKPEPPVYGHYRKGVVPFEAGPIFEATWGLFKERMGTCLGVCWTAFGLIWLSSFLQQMIQQDVLASARDPVVFFLLSFALFFGGYVLSVWLSIGQNLGLLALARRRQAVLEELFRGGPFLLTMILSSVIFGAIVGIVVLASFLLVPLGSALAPDPLIGMVVAFGVVGIVSVLVVGYVIARLSQFYFLIIDRNAGVIESLQWSWQITHRKVVGISIIYTLAIMINLAGLLCCFVGLIFTVPFTYLMFAVTYLSITEQPMAAEEPDIGWLDEEEDQL
jgi:hypothetical protein